MEYDAGVGGYVVNLSKDKLLGGPHYAAGADPGWGDRDNETKLHSYYGAGTYWAVTLVCKRRIPASAGIFSTA
jgi:hypothetical protein